MTDIDPSLADAGRTVCLSDTESAEAEQTLHTFMKEHPVNMTAAVAKRETRSPWDAIRSLFSLRHGTAMAAVVICVLGGGSLSYAAESALPGDALYPIKVHVNEEVRATLATSAEAKAAWDTRRAERRVREAEQLAEQDRLTPEANTILIAAFQEHVKDAESNIQLVADTGKEEMATSLHQEMERKLHGKVAALDRRIATLSNMRHDPNDEISLMLKNDASDKTTGPTRTISAGSSKEQSSSVGHDDDEIRPNIALGTNQMGLMQEEQPHSSESHDGRNIEVDVHLDTKFLINPAATSKNGKENNRKAFGKNGSRSSTGSGSSSLHTSSAVSSSSAMSTSSMQSATESDTSASAQSSIDASLSSAVTDIPVLDQVVPNVVP